MEPVHPDIVPEEQCFQQNYISAKLHFVGRTLHRSLDRTYDLVISIPIVRQNKNMTLDDCILSVAEQ